MWLEGAPIHGHFIVSLVFQRIHALGGYGLIKSEGKAGNQPNILVSVQPIFVMKTTFKAQHFLNHLDYQNLND